MYRRRKHAPVEVKNIDEINYKNLEVLKSFVSESYQIIPSRISGVSAKFQRRVATEVKKARFLALLPFCDSHN